MDPLKFLLDYALMCPVGPDGCGIQKNRLNNTSVDGFGDVVSNSPGIMGDGHHGIRGAEGFIIDKINMVGPGKTSVEYDTQVPEGRRVFNPDIINLNWNVPPQDAALGKKDTGSFLMIDGESVLS